MKKSTPLMITILVMEISTRSAWAAGSEQTYGGNMLILLFLGVFALIVVSRMVPALILIMGLISSFAKRVAVRKQVAVVNVNQDETR